MPDPEVTENAMIDALKYMALGEDEQIERTHTHGYTIAHLRIPRIEIMEYDSLDHFHHVIAQLIVDKTMTALVTATWPGHE